MCLEGGVKKLDFRSLPLIHLDVLSCIFLASHLLAVVRQLPSCAPLALDSLLSRSS